MARSLEGAPGVSPAKALKFLALAVLVVSCGVGGTTVPARGSGKDIFIARLDAEGAVVWARAFGGAGAFDSTVTTSTEADAVTVAFDADGAVRWSRLVSGGGASFGNEVAVDDDGRIAVVGSYADAASFGPAITLPAPASGGQDAFPVLYGADGQPLWARSLAAPDSGATAPRAKTRGEGHGWPELISPFPRMHHAARFAADFTPCNALDFLSVTRAFQRS